MTVNNITKFFLINRIIFKHNNCETNKIKNVYLNLMSLSRPHIVITLYFRLASRNILCIQQNRNTHAVGAVYAFKLHEYIHTRSNYN